MDPKIPFTALILCGGTATRLDGIDKGLIRINGLTLVEHTLKRLDSGSFTIIINANRNIPQYQALGYPVITDGNQDFNGPLAGISQALSSISTEWLLVIPCDTPLLPLDLPKKLYTKTLESSAKIIYCSDGKHGQYLHCLIHRSLASDLNQWLTSGQRAVRRWLETQQTEMLVFKNKNAFLNINTSEDIDSLKFLLKNKE